MDETKINKKGFFSMYDRAELKRMIEIEIQTKYSDPNFNVAILSKNFNRCNSHFRELVYEIFSINPQKLIECERMRQAVKLILRGEKIYKIALAVGYLNIRSFRKAFYNQYGYSPIMYKKKIKT
jgi:AraC-like DNA-binding protein